MSQASRVKDYANVRAFAQKLQLLLADIRKFCRDYFASAWTRLRSRDWKRAAKAALQFWKELSSFIWSLIWLAIAVLIAVLLIEGLTGRMVAIEPITVPKRLEENGFTAQVAAQRLRDALNGFAKTVRTHMKNPKIQLHGEELNIVVPAVGLSLDAIVAMMRTFFHSDYRKNISGDLIISGTKLWLRLRLNGMQFYNSTEGGDPDNPDQLFDAAAQAVLGKTYPYIVASDLYYRDPAKALEMAERIIA